MYLLPLVMTVVSHDHFTKCALVDELVQEGEVTHALYEVHIIDFLFQLSLTSYRLLSLDQCAILLNL